MIFYLCQTADGPQLAGTQADAKALDRNFEQVDLPTDKAGYMAYVNDLLSKARPAASVVVELDEEGEERGVIAEPVKPKKAEPPKRDRLWDQIELEEHIFSIGPKDTGKLDAIERTVAARRDELAKGIMV